MEPTAVPPTITPGHDQQRNRRLVAIYAVVALLATAAVLVAAGRTGSGDTPAGSEPTGSGAATDMGSPGADDGSGVAGEANSTGAHGDDPVDGEHGEPSTGPDDQSDESDDDGTSTPGSDADTDAAPAPGEDDLDAADDSAGYPDWTPPGGAQGGGPAPPDDGDGPTELDPIGDDEPAPPDPCDPVLEAGRALLVTDDPTVLASGDMTGELTITNCSAASVDWTAHTKPSVALATAAGTLGADESTSLGFQIDDDQWDPGAIEFKIKVSEPGANTYVDVQAYQPLVGSDIVPDGIGFTAPEGSGGCALQCITKALLTPNATSPNVSLEVETNVPATIRVFVSTQAPVGPDDAPQFPGVGPIASSPAGMTDWTAPLSPLAPTTSYHIIVEATDAHDNTAYRVGTFTTLTPLELPGGFNTAGPEPGCSTQCILSAVLSPTGLHSTLDLAVGTHTPAVIDVFVSTSVPGMAAGDPDVASMAHAASSDALTENWGTQLTGLDGDTTYHIVVRATDANGNRAFQAGAFHTADEPPVDVRVTFHKIHVTHDGDSSIGNRGELSVGWAVDNEVVGTRGEEKMHSDTTVWIGDANDDWVVHDVGGYLPAFRVSGSERDADGLVEFCTMGTGVPLDWGFSEDCDAKWNVATSGIYTVNSLDGFDRCHELGVGDAYSNEACIEVATVSHGDDYARFTVVVSYEIIS